MSRRNTDKHFYVDVGTSIAAVRCQSNRDVLIRFDNSSRDKYGIKRATPAPSKGEWSAKADALAPVSPPALAGQLDL